MEWSLLTTPVARFIVCTVMNFLGHITCVLISCFPMSPAACGSQKSESKTSLPLLNPDPKMVARVLELKTAKEAEAQLDINSTRAWFYNPKALNSLGHLEESIGEALKGVPKKVISMILLVVTSRLHCHY